MLRGEKQVDIILFVCNIILRKKLRVKRGTIVSSAVQHFLSAG